MSSSNGMSSHIVTICVNVHYGSSSRLYRTWRRCACGRVTLCLIITHCVLCSTCTLSIRYCVPNVSCAVCCTDRCSFPDNVRQHRANLNDEVYLTLGKMEALQNEVGRVLNSINVCSNSDMFSVIHYTIKNYDYNSIKLKRICSMLSRL